MLCVRWWPSTAQIPDFSDVLNWLRALLCVKIHQKICLKIGRFYKVKHQAHCEMWKPALLPVEFFCVITCLNTLGGFWQIYTILENKDETFDWPYLMAFKWSSTLYSSVFHLYESLDWETISTLCWMWKMLVEAQIWGTDVHAQVTMLKPSVNKFLFQSSSKCNTARVNMTNACGIRHGWF